MGAPKGNKFSKNGGRKGYTYERDQLLIMRKILNSFLALLQKVMSGKATARQIACFLRVYHSALKVMDKLHANQQHLDADLNTDLQYHFIINANESNNNIPDNSIPPTTPSV